MKSTRRATSRSWCTPGRTYLHSLDWIFVALRRARARAAAARGAGHGRLPPHVQARGQYTAVQESTVQHTPPLLCFPCCCCHRQCLLQSEAVPALFCCHCRFAVLLSCHFAVACAVATTSVAVATACAVASLPVLWQGEAVPPRGSAGGSSALPRVLHRWVPAGRSPSGLSPRLTTSLCLTSRRDPLCKVNTESNILYHTGTGTPSRWDSLCELIPTGLVLVLVPLDSGGSLFFFFFPQLMVPSRGRSLCHFLSPRLP